MDEEIDRLYGLPLEEFVPERDALAKRLRAEKRRDEADAVKALRKPSVAAWAVNQALRSNPAEQRALLKAGDALRRAQEKLVAGRGDAAAVREASEGERQAVGALLTAARGLAREKGFLSEPVLNRVRETLHAAATDDEARTEIEAARVSREHRPAAFGGWEAPAAPPKQPRRKPAPDRKAEERERKEQERARRQQAQAELKAARAEEREAAQRRREAERALEAAEKAERKAAERRAAAEEAL